MKFALLFAGSTLAVDGLKQKNRKLRGSQAERNLPYSQSLNSPTNNAWGSDFVATPAPTPWSGDAWGGLSTESVTEDGLEGRWGGSWITGGSKSNKMTLNVAGGLPKKREYVQVSGVSGRKKNKGYGINVSGKKIDKGNGLNVSGSSESGSGIYVSGAGGKSKGSFTIPGGSTKHNNETPAQPVNVQSVDGWSSDGHVPVPVPVVRGKWSGDGHITPLVTPNPTPYPTWKGDAHVVTPLPTWKGDAHPPSNEPVIPVITPAPSSCEVRMFWHPNDDYTMCSNEENYESDSSYIYTTLEACCKAMFAYNNVMFCCNVNFGAGSVMNGSCQYVDVCNTLPPSPSIVTPEPTPSPETPAPTPCEAQVFYFDGNVCSNEFIIADASAYNSAMACCNMNFGSGSFMNGQCNYVDECNTLRPSPSMVTPEPTPSPIETIVTPSPVTPAPTPCESLLFFFDGETCSNEFYIADASSYESPAACCNANFGMESLTTGSCNYVDICNTLPPSPAPVTTEVTPPPTEMTLVTPPPTEAIATPPPSPEPTPIPSVETIISPPTPVPTPIPTDMISVVPTPAPSFGATPTVSKETTGPPTMHAGRDN
ncbi:hypothetical protein ACHAXN_005775 [Cyclotella atomus]